MTTHRTVRLLTLDGRPWASAGFAGGLPSDAWAWIASVVSEDCECDPENVGCEESDEGDLVTVAGVPVYKIGIGHLN